MELFAGNAEATKQFRVANMRAARLDLLYMKSDSDQENPMDLTTPAGFASLASVLLVVCLYVFSSVGKGFI